MANARIASHFIQFRSTRIPIANLTSLFTVVGMIRRHREGRCTVVQLRRAQLLPSIYPSLPPIAPTIQIPRGSIATIPVLHSRHRVRIPSIPMHHPPTKRPHGIVRISRERVDELAVLALTLPSQEIATNLGILLHVTFPANSDLSHTTVSFRYPSFPTNTLTLEHVQKTAAFPARALAVLEVATRVREFLHRLCRTFFWKVRGMWREVEPIDWRSLLCTSFPSNSLTSVQLRVVPRVRGQEAVRRVSRVGEKGGSGKRRRLEGRGGVHTGVRRAVGEERGTGMRDEGVEVGEERRLAEQLRGGVFRGCAAQTI